MSTEIPTYNPNEPAHIQENDWDCSVESTEWALWSWGRTTDDDWIENSMIAAGVVSPSVGLCDASGAGLADWCNTEYGEFGYEATNQNPIGFDDLALEAAELSHPIMAGGRAFYHWVGVCGYDSSRDVLLLANPAPGYKGVYDTMSRTQFAQLGSFSMVRLMHPVAEGIEPAPPTKPDLDYTWWLQDGKIGTGLIDMMREDGVYPAQDYSTWLPLGRNPAQIEECMARDGTMYRWSLVVSQGFRYRPS